jgi:DNA repair photolyase
VIQKKQVVSVLNKHKKRDAWFLDDYSINPYEGCSCNCLYCYVRGSKYGENMEDGLFVKENALQVLEKQLQSRARRNQYGIVVVGSATDAYLHHEKDWKITKGMLELLLKYRFPVFISTKCELVLRDIDLLKEIDKTAILPPDLKQTLKRGVILSVSLSTMDEKIASMLEPGALAPLQRLQLIQYLKAEGFLAGVNAMPLLPYISDTTEAMEELVAAAKVHNADYILAAGLTLFGQGKADSKTLYYHFLRKFNPSLVAAYDKLYGNDYYVQQQYALQLKDRVDGLARKYAIRTSIIE